MNNSYTSGFLQVTVLGGNGINPISGALVTVSSEGRVVATAYTDNSGSTPPIPITAYNEDYNTPSAMDKEIKRESIEVSAGGYYNGTRNDIPIFPGIVTREYVYMIPLALKSGDPNSIYRETIKENTASETEGEEGES